MFNTLLEERISQLSGKKTPEQVELASSILMESPNGEAPFVFAELKGTEAERILKDRFDAATGLMTEDYFNVNAEHSFSRGDRAWTDSRGRMPMSYVLVDGDVQQVKEYLKTNPVVRTQLIGHVDGVVGALLLCDEKTARKVMAGFDGAQGIVGYSPLKKLAEAHDVARKDLIADARFRVVKAIEEGRDAPIDAYLGLKDRYKR